MRVGRRGAALALLACVAAAHPLRAQAGGSPAASPLLPAGHWSLEAARRVEAMGLLPAALPPRATLPREVVGDALRAAAADSGAAPRARALAEGWYERLAGEFPEIRPSAAPPAVRLLGSSAGVGYGEHRGRGAPGRGERANQTGVQPLPDESAVEATLDLAAALGDHLAVSAAPSVGDGADVSRWDVMVAGGPLYLAVGRQPVGYGKALGGGMVLSGAEPLERVEVATARVVRLPGWLRALGPVSAHTFLARLPPGRHPGDPVFWGASGTFQPHPRLQLAIHRAAMIGGEMTGAPVTAWTVLQAFVGIHAGIENQVVSGEARFRLPTERWVAATVYCELGAEDSAGAVSDVPGYVCGALVPALPGAPALAVGVEHARFAASCCGNPPWYRHSMFPGGWNAEDRPLGRQLGGNGWEWLGHLGWSGPGASVQVEGRGFLRDRGPDNVFVPGRAGRSRGAASVVDWRATAGSAVWLEAGVEDGAGWSERFLRLGARILF